MNIQQHIIDVIQLGLTKSGLNVVDILLEHPADISHGDYSTNVAMVAAKESGKNPKELAQALVDTMETDDIVEAIEIAGPGFINFRLSQKFFAEQLEHILSLQDAWGANTLLEGQEIMVEYTDPNPFKAFHIGHLMSNAIGESIARLIAFSGAHVIRANYQGDVGPHVAKALWGVKKLGVDASNAAALGQAYAAGATAYEDDTSAKEEIDAINIALYEDTLDDELDTFYTLGRAASLAHFEELYRTLGTTFDHYFFESEVWKSGAELVEGHPDIFPESDGAKVFKGEDVGLHTRVFVTAKGTPTYEAKDLGLVQHKVAVCPSCDVFVTITASEQTEYFKVIKAAMNELFPELADKVRHIPHGMMRLPEGKMSSRTGDVITGESLLDEIEGVVRERNEDTDTARAVAVGAIKYAILKQSTGKNIIFEKERALSIEGDSGPYIQYAYARTLSVIAKAADGGLTPKVDSTQSVRDIEKILYRFSEVVERAVREYEPHYVATYISELASAFNSWYGQEVILNDSDDVPHKLAITQAVATTLKRGLDLLGIEAPERM